MNWFFGLFGLLVGIAILVGALIYERLSENQKKKRRTFVVIVLVVLPAIGLVVGYVREVIESARADEHSQRAAMTQRGYADGGTSRLQIMFLHPVQAEEDGISVSATVTGSFPMRSVSVRIIDETKQMEGRVRLVKEQVLGDVPPDTYIYLGWIPLDPAVTNYYRFYINALNGFSSQIISLSKVTNGWATHLYYKHEKIGEKVTIEPSNLAGKTLTF